MDMDTVARQSPCGAFAYLLRQRALHKKASTTLSESLNCGVDPSDHDTSIPGSSTLGWGGVRVVTQFQRRGSTSRSGCWHRKAA
jgi:hypothetical protein